MSEDKCDDTPDSIFGMPIAVIPYMPMDCWHIRGFEPTKEPRVYDVRVTNHDWVTPSHLELSDREAADLSLRLRRMHEDIHTKAVFGTTQHIDEQPPLTLEATNEWLRALTEAGHQRRVREIKMLLEAGYSVHFNPYVKEGFRHLILGPEYAGAITEARKQFSNDLAETVSREENDHG